MGRPARLPRRDGRRRPAGRLGAAAHDDPHRRDVERDLDHGRRSRSARACGLFEGGAAGEAYFAGYAMEKALSLDNVFVFTLIFAALAVPRDEQPRVLLWGILIALVLRGLLIVVGAEALEQYSWVAWPFAAPAGLDRLADPAFGRRATTRARRSSRACAGAFPRVEPAVAALLAVAVADVLFAVDSVPAILAITTDTFIVFAANAFALLGLRALFFLVAGAVQRFAYLQLGLGVLLIGIAGKLVYGELSGEKLATSVTLGSIVAVLVAAIGASVLKERRALRTPPRGVLTMGLFLVCRHRPAAVRAVGADEGQADLRQVLEGRAAQRHVRRGRGRRRAPLVRPAEPVDPAGRRPPDRPLRPAQPDAQPEPGRRRRVIAGRARRRRPRGRPRDPGRQALRADADPPGARPGGHDRPVAVVHPGRARPDHGPDRAW